MLTVICKSDETCLICGSKDKVSEVVINKKYRMTLCWNHAWDKVPAHAPKKGNGKDATTRVEGQTSRRPAVA